eukprot:1562421-Pleurochrysis_carterae.AAC.2
MRQLTNFESRVEEHERHRSRVQRDMLRLQAALPRSRPPLHSEEHRSHGRMYVRLRADARVDAAGCVRTGLHGSVLV